MEAQKLKKKKGVINKNKIKKTIKNIICRPDPLFWPVVTEAERNILENILKKHRVQIPEFKKPHWNEVKLIPKKERIKPPPVEKVVGLLVGLSECSKSVDTKDCSAVLIEANVNPQAIVQPIIEACTSSNISILCLKDLRLLSQTTFGFKTSCLGVKKDCLQELSDKIHEIYQSYKPKMKTLPIPCSKMESCEIEKVDNIKKEDILPTDINTYCPYVYRTNKKSRTFIPPNAQIETKINNKFIGQHFIKVLQESKPDNNSKTYMRMMLKRISNNPNRVKQK